MIRYILGRSGTGKSRYIHKRIKKNLGKKQILIVPEQYTLQAEIELIKDLESEGFIDVEVISFHRLCNKILAETGGTERVAIDSIGKSMVLRSILDQHSSELLVFESISKKTGFIDKLGTLISEFKRAGIDEVKLTQTISEEDIFFNRKLKDLSLILGCYNQFMSGDYFDEEDFIKLVIDRISFTDFIKDSIIYLDGFDSFSNNEYELLERLFGHASEVNIALTIDIYQQASVDLFIPVAKTFERIRKIVKELDIEEKRVDLKEVNRHPDLEILEREFFSYPYTPSDSKPEHLELHLCNNIYDEVERVVMDIEDQVRSKRMRYKDISIVTGDIDSYAQVIKRVFNTYKIPYFIDDKVDIKRHPIVQLILSTLACLHSGFKAEDVFKVIKTRLSDMDTEASFSFENYILSVGMRGSKWFKPIEDETMENVRLSFITPLEDVKNQLKTKNTVTDTTKILYEYLLALNVPGKLEAWNKTLETNNRLDKIQETTQIWNLTIGLFDQLVDLKGDEVLTVKEYMRILEAGFNEMTLGIIPPSVDQVVIGTIERSKNKPSKAMYVIGLNDGLIPRKYSDESLILDDEKRHLKEKGIDLDTDSSSIMSRDYFSTYVAFTKATEKLHISLSLSDYEGKALRPSIYLDKFKRIFTALEVKSHLIETDGFEHKYNQITYFNLLTKQLRDSADMKVINNKWFNVLSWYDQNSQMQISSNDLYQALYYDNQVQVYDKTKVETLYKLPLVSSVSRLERFNRCPFSHFVHYGLRPKERKLHEIKLPDIGMLFHKTLEEFDRVMKEKGVSWQTVTKEEADKLIDEIVDVLVEDYNHYIFSSSYRYGYMIRKLKRVGKRAAWTLVLQVKKGKFEPYAHEIEFSSRGKMYTVPPIVVELSDGSSMMIEGRIDRIDIYEENGIKYVKVIDYKSGSKKFNLGEVYHGLQLQLMVYLDAILKNSHYFRVDELYPAGVFYFKIDDPLIESELLKGEMTEVEILKLLKMDGLVLKDINIATAMDEDIVETKKSFVIPVELKKDETFNARSKVASLEDFELLVGYVRNTLRDIGSRISKGDLEIKPYKLGTYTGCMSCNYDNICQFDSAFGNQYKVLSSLKDDEVFELLKGEEDA